MFYSERFCIELGFCLQKDASERNISFPASSEELQHAVVDAVVFCASLHALQRKVSSKFRLLKDSFLCIMYASDGTLANTVLFSNQSIWCFRIDKLDDIQFLRQIELILLVGTLAR